MKDNIFYISLLAFIVMITAILTNFYLDYKKINNDYSIDSRRLELQYEYINNNGNNVF